MSEAYQGRSGGKEPLQQPARFIACCFALASLFRHASAAFRSSYPRLVFFVCVFIAHLWRDSFVFGFYCISPAGVSARLGRGPYVPERVLSL